MHNALRESLLMPTQKKSWERRRKTRKKKFKARHFKREAAHCGEHLDSVLQVTQSASSGWWSTAPTWISTWSGPDPRCTPPAPISTQVQPGSSCSWVRSTWTQDI